MRLFGHTLSRRDDRILEMFTGQFREVFERFTKAMGGALPHLDRAEVSWRILFMVGAMAHTMIMADDIQQLTGETIDHNDVDGVIHRLVPFLVAGLQTPVPSLKTGGA